MTFASSTSSSGQPPILHQDVISAVVESAQAHSAALGGEAPQRAIHQTQQPARGDLAIDRGGNIAVSRMPVSTATVANASSIETVTKEFRIVIELPNGKKSRFRVEATYPKGLNESEITSFWRNKLRYLASNHPTELPEPQCSHRMIVEEDGFSVEKEDRTSSHNDPMFADSCKQYTQGKPDSLKDALRREIPLITVASKTTRNNPKQPAQIEHPENRNTCYLASAVWELLHSPDLLAELPNAVNRALDNKETTKVDALISIADVIHTAQGAKVSGEEILKLRTALAKVDNKIKDSDVMADADEVFDSIKKMILNAPESANQIQLERTPVEENALYMNLSPSNGRIAIAFNRSAPATDSNEKTVLTPSGNAKDVEAVTTILRTPVNIKNFELTINGQPTELTFVRFFTGNHYRSLVRKPNEFGKMTSYLCDDMGKGVQLLKDGECLKYLSDHAQEIVKVVRTDKRVIDRAIDDLKQRAPTQPATPLPDNEEKNASSPTPVPASRFQSTYLDIYVGDPKPNGALYINFADEKRQSPAIPIESKVEEIASATLKDKNHFWNGDKLTEGKFVLAEKGDGRYMLLANPGKSTAELEETTKQILTLPQVQSFDSTIIHLPIMPGTLPQQQIAAIQKAANDTKKKVILVLTQQQFDVAQAHRERILKSASTASSSSSTAQVPLTPAEPLPITESLTKSEEIKQTLPATYRGAIQNIAASVPILGRMVSPAQIESNQAVQFSMHKANVTSAQVEEALKERYDLVQSLHITPGQDPLRYRNIKPDNDTLAKQAILSNLVTAKQSSNDKQKLKVALLVTPQQTGEVDQTATAALFQSAIKDMLTMRSQQIKEGDFASITAVLLPAAPPTQPQAASATKPPADPNPATPSAKSSWFMPNAEKPRGS